MICSAPLRLNQCALSARSLVNLAVALFPFGTLAWYASAPLRLILIFWLATPQPHSKALSCAVATLRCIRAFLVPRPPSLPRASLQLPHQPPALLGASKNLFYERNYIAVFFAPAVLGVARNRSALYASQKNKTSALLRFYFFVLRCFFFFKTK